jgi:hypothetical protein
VAVDVNQSEGDTIVRLACVRDEGEGVAAYRRPGRP